MASCSFVAIVLSVSEQSRHGTVRISTQHLKSVIGEQASRFRSHLGARTAGFSALLQEQAGFFARVINFQVLRYEVCHHPVLKPCFYGYLLLWVLVMMQNLEDFG